MTILQTLMPNPGRVKLCVFCGSVLKRRTLDTPAVIKVRLKEYEERTKPIFGFLKKRGYVIHNIDGEPLPFQVSKKIMRVIELGMKKN